MRFSLKIVADRLFEPREVCVDRRRTFADDLFESLKAEVGNEVGITVQHREIRRRLGKLRLGVREPFTAPVVQQITQQCSATVLAGITKCGTLFWVWKEMVVDGAVNWLFQVERRGLWCDRGDMIAKFRWPVMAVENGDGRLLWYGLWG